MSLCLLMPQLLMCLCGFAYTSRYVQELVKTRKGVAAHAFVSRCVYILTHFASIYSHSLYIYVSLYTCNMYILYVYIQICILTRTCPQGRGSAWLHQPVCLYSHTCCIYMLTHTTHTHYSHTLLTHTSTTICTRLHTYLIRILYTYILVCMLTHYYTLARTLQSRLLYI